MANGSEVRDRAGEARSLIIVTRHIHPDARTNSVLLTDMGAGLVERGWRVDLLACVPPKSRKAEPRPGEIGGVRIRRIWAPLPGGQGIVSRLINSLVLSTLMFLRLLFGRRPDVVLVDTISPFQAPAVWFASVLRGYRYVYLATELYPDVAVALGYLRPNGFIVRLWDWMNRRIYGRARQVVVIGPRLREKVKRHLKGGIDDPKLKVIHNWTDTEAIKPVDPEDNWFRKEHGLQDKLVVLYSGNMGLSHDIETLIEAADILREDERVRFLFIGGGQKRPAIERMAADRQLPNVQFLSFQPIEVLPYSLSSGDLSVVTLEAAMDQLTIPSKLYPAMAAGQAILALMGRGSEVGEMVEEMKIGVRVTQGDAQGLVDALLDLLEHPEKLAEMKRRSREEVVRQFDRRLAMDAYESVLLEAVGREILK